MPDYIIAYDLGTGGNKASLYDAQGVCLASRFVPYATFYPKPGCHEQRPNDWWQAIVQSTQVLLADSNVNPRHIVSLGLSGHSLGVVPLDRQGRLLREFVPIWSDARSAKQTSQFFRQIEEADWYLLTGNGFPPALYSVFKIMWYRDNEPDMFSQIAKVIGTKDFINYRLTGQIATDHSYASGCGVYDLVQHTYAGHLIAAAGLSPELFPEIVPATTILGTLTAEAAETLGLSPQTKVVAGGVDNACMALGARVWQEGQVYNSLGSSSWIAASSHHPLLQPNTRPYVFAHVVPDMFVSATAIFSAGSSFRWLRDLFCHDLIEQAARENRDVYELMIAEADLVPVGANHLLFNPSLAGGSSLDTSPDIRGALMGLTLSHTRGDIIRAAMEGIALGLRIALDALGQLALLDQDMVVVGGGSRSPLWCQIYADVYNKRIVKTNIDQQTAALGAAGVAAVGCGLWDSFDMIETIHHIEDIVDPIPEHVTRYEALLQGFKQAGHLLSQLHIPE